VVFEDLTDHEEAPEWSDHLDFSENKVKLDQMVKQERPDHEDLTEPEETTENLENQELQDEVEAMELKEIPVNEE